MTYDINTHRRSAREHYTALAKAGPGWQPYVIDKAERLVKEDPIVHGGLVAAIESEIGPEATKAARRALAWFEKETGNAKRK